jgi:site-specific DNA-methyltransferase (adenine-specific)
MFDMKIKEIELLKPGYLIPSLREATVSTLENPGKSWSQDDLQRLNSEYNKLLSEGITKKDILVKLGKDLGRGRWSLEKALKKAGVAPGKKGRKKTLSDFGV